MERLLALLVAVSLEALVALGDQCPRDRSRVARAILDEVVLPSFAKFGVQVPSSCLWAPQRDIYRAQEEHKSWVSEYQWDCRFCGKAFYTEDFLDQHMRRKHDEAEYRGEDKVCVAEYCSVLRCDALQPGATIGYWERALCKDREMAPIRETCEKIVHSCVPSEDEKGEEVRSELLKNVCSYLTCAKRWTHPPNWGRLWNVTYLILGLVVGLGSLVVVMVYCLSQASGEPRRELYHPSPRRSWQAEPAFERSTRRRKYAYQSRARHGY